GIANIDVAYCPLHELYTSHITLQFVFPRFPSRVYDRFFSIDTAPTEIYTLSLHDALPILPRRPPRRCTPPGTTPWPRWKQPTPQDRKSTRLNSSHVKISYAVFCLKKKNARRKLKPASKSSSILDAPMFP